MAAIMSAGGSILQGQAQGKAYDFNASVERQQGNVALDQSYVQARQTQDQIARRSGQAKSAFGAAGVVGTTGSALHVLNDIASEGEMARQLQLYQGRVTAFGHEQQSDADIAQGSAAKTAGWISGITSLVNSGSTQAGNAGLISPTMSAALAF